MKKLNDFFNENGYVIVKDFISTDILQSHYHYLLDMYKEGKMSVDKNQVVGNLTLRDDIVFDTLLSKMRPLISKVVDKELWPTYAFTRLYRNGEKLKKHTDRESCEYSISLTLGFSNGRGIWPIYLKNKEGKTIKTKLEIGEALIYTGRDLPHWRKKFKGDHYVQTFLHYVDSEGPYKEWVFDKRQGLNSLDYDINFNFEKTGRNVDEYESFYEDKSFDEIIL
jgi:hypothetical protein